MGLFAATAETPVSLEEEVRPRSKRLATLPFPFLYPKRRTFWLSRLLWLSVGLLYVVAFPYHPELYSANEQCRLWQTRAIVDHGELSLNRVQSELGRVRDLSVVNGTFYPSKAPLMSVAAIPVYAVLEQFGAVSSSLYAAWAPERERPLGAANPTWMYFSRLFVTVLPSLFLLFLLRRFLLHYVAAPVADSVVATYAIGSLGFSYTHLFMSHGPTAVLLFSSFYLLWRAVRGERGAWAFVASGALAALAVCAEYTLALGWLGLVAYLWSEASRTEGSETTPLRALLVVPSAVARQRFFRWTGLFVLGAAPFLGLLALYHVVVFGHPLDTGYKHLADAGYQPWHIGGFLGVGLPSWHAMSLSLFSPLRGLFTLSPFLMVAFGGFGPLKKPGIPTQLETAADAGSRGLWAMTVLLTLSYAYFTSAFAYESWGWTTGPRHLTPLIPFLLLPLALTLSNLRADVLRFSSLLLLGTCAGLCSVSILVMGALTLIDYVPDSVSNAFFALVVPLWRDGYLPPSIAGLWGGSGGVGLARVLAGAVVLVALLVSWLLISTPRTASVAGLVRGAKFSPRPWRERIWAFSLAAFVVVSHFAIADVSHRGDEADAKALGHLQKHWWGPRPVPR